MEAGYGAHAPRGESHFRPLRPLRPRIPRDPTAELGMKSSLAANAGMSLLECLAYIAIFAMIVNLSMSAFVSASRLSAFGSASLERLAITDDLRDAVSSVVREARAVVAGVGAYHTGEDTLVVELPSLPGQPMARRYAVIGCVTSKDRLARMEMTETDGKYEITWCSTYSLPIAAVRFSYDTPDPLRARLISIETDAVNTHKGKPPVPYRFQAALRSRAAGDVT